MIQVGINYQYWFGLTEGNLDQTLKLTSKTGADVIEYSAPKLAALSRQQRVDFKNAATDHGMTVAVTGGMGSDFDLSSPNAEVRKNSIALARQAIDVCADVGSGDWCGVIYGRWLDLPKVPLTTESRREVWERAVSSLKEVSKYAEDKNVIISMEILNRFECFLLTTVEQGLSFVQDVGNPYARLLLDVFHMNIEEDSMIEAIKKATSLNRMGHLHVSESNRQIPGLKKTDMPWDVILSAVKNSGYNGVVSIESFVQMSASNAVGLSTWRNLINNPNEKTMVAAAAQGVSFLKNHLQ